MRTSLILYGSLFWLCTLFLSSCSDSSPKNSAEKKNSHYVTWEYEHNIENKREFDLTLKIDDTQIIGSHCFVGQGGTRIDAAQDEQTVIAHKVDNNIYKGAFASAYTSDTYPLTITISAQKIDWEIETDAAPFYPAKMSFIKT